MWHLIPSWRHRITREATTLQLLCRNVPPNQIKSRRWRQSEQWASCTSGPGVRSARRRLLMSSAEGHIGQLVLMRARAERGGAGSRQRATDMTADSSRERRFQSKETTGVQQRSWRNLTDWRVKAWMSALSWLSWRRVGTRLDTFMNKIKLWNKT